MKLMSRKNCFCKTAAVVVALFVAIFDSKTQADELNAENDFKRFAIGAYGALGFAGCVGETCREGVTFFGTTVIPKMNKFGFSGSGGAYFNYYFHRNVALDAGFGFISRGARYDGSDETRVASIACMEFPLGVKFAFYGFQIGAGLAFHVALSGKWRSHTDDGDDVDEWDDFEWDNVKRFNLGPKLFLGYAIKAGPVAVVPGFEWSMDLLNNAKGDLEDLDGEMRFMNLMFRLGVDFGF